MAVKVHPTIPMHTESFRDGFQEGISGEYNGWPTQDAPQEDTIVEFVNDMLMLLPLLTDEEVRWLCGLLAGWLSRPVQ